MAVSDGVVVLLVSFGLLTGSTSSACPRIISRSSWGARTPLSTRSLAGPVRYAFIHHGASGICSNYSTCSAIVRGCQDHHMDTNGWDDIGYSFLIGEDGNVYDGRDWDRVGSHARGYNRFGLGFCFIGNFTTRAPNSAALKPPRTSLHAVSAWARFSLTTSSEATATWSARPAPGQLCTTSSKRGRTIEMSISQHICL